MKKWFLVLMIILLTQKVLAFNNPTTKSYGVWEVENESVIFSKHVLEKIKKILKNSMVKNMLYRK